MPGPAPKSSSQKELEGTSRADRAPRNVASPKRLTKLTPPHYLDQIGKNEWRRMARKLSDLGLLTEIDVTALAAYCDCYSRWRAARQEARVETFTTETGYVGINPFVPLAMKLEARLQAWLREFGMTPAARSRVEAVASPSSGAKASGKPTVLQLINGRAS